MNGDESAGSARIHGINVHKKLIALGYDSRIVVSPAALVTDLTMPLHRRLHWRVRQLRQDDRVIVLKLKGRRAHHFVAAVRARARVSFIDCDLPLKLHMAKQAHAVICPSEVLHRLYIEAGLQRVHYIPDSPEAFRAYHGRASQEIYRCVWFGRGSARRWDTVRFLKDLLARSPALRNWRLTTISDHPDADVPWDRQAFQRINQCDAVLIPCSHEERDAAKSGNRALQAMALSVPVLASPIHEYCKLIEHGVNGFLCEDAQAWIQALSEIALNIDYRLSVIQTAYQFAERFHLDTIIQQWIGALQL